MKGGRGILGRIAAVLMAVWVITGSATAGVMEDAGRLLWPGDEAESWTLTLGVQLETWPPYGERRTELANRMLRHLTMEIRKDASGAALLQVMTDSRPSDACMRIAPQAAEPGTDGMMTEEEAAEAMHAVFLMLEDGASFLASLPEKVPDRCSEKKVKQKLKTGTATRSVTVTLTPPEEGEHPLCELIRNAEEQAVRDRLKDWTVRGKAQFTLLYDEEGQLLKATAGVRAGESEETLRNIRLEWRLKRTAEEKQDEVTLKTPLTEGSGRDNWILTRKWQAAAAASQDESGKADEGHPELLEFTFEYDQKHGNDKAQYRWDGALNGTDGGGLAGSISWTSKRKNDTETLTLKPDLNLCNEKQASGDLAIIRVSDKIEQEHVTLHMEWRKEAAGTAESPQTETDAESFQKELIRTLLSHVPEEDLGFLLEDLSEGSRQQILDAAKKP